jgi:hypothetical protein
MKMKRLRTYEDGKTLVSDRYLIPENGKYIRDKETGEKLLPKIHNGYMCIPITICGKYINSAKMATLQWWAWEGEIPNGYVLHHRDLNKQNDHKDNFLCLSSNDHTRLHHTDKEMSESTRKKLSKYTGERSSKGKLSEDKMEELRYEFWFKEFSYEDLSKKYNYTIRSLRHFFGSKNLAPDRYNPKKLTIGQFKEELSLKQESIEKRLGG